VAGAPDARPGLILQHAETGPPGRLGEWATRRAMPFGVHRSWETPPELDPTDYGWVASLGSAESVNATDPAWITTEIDFLGRAVAADVPVLGLCWGGQALSRALGGRVGPAPVAEKGWLAIESREAAIPAGPWLHYHMEVFTMPAGAVELARSPAGPAAFRIGPHLGLQFHPEADRAIVAGWAAKDPGQTEATRAALDAEADRWDAGAARLATQLFDRWWADAVRARAAPAAGSGRRS
jgi:GMP synthase-like glutamine amidotransferase